LATVDWGTALAPIYQAHEQGVDLHVWVDETRPRNQGAMLTAFELAEQGVPHTLISDNSGGHLMQCGEVDLCIVGSDRTAANGDVCNKIGTYLKALAAKANAVPFYVALPSSTIDWQLDKGVDIPIEYRSEDEVRFVSGWHETSQSVQALRICPEQTSALNPAFDVTPNSLVSGLITEHGLFNANKESLNKLKALVDGK
jgi:methylthioribose-1-phosphate isomerase